MQPICICRITALNFCLIICAAVNAQPGMNLYTDMGANNVSDGIFIKSVVSGFLTSGKYRVETGFQNDLRSNGSVLFSGCSINASRFIAARRSRFELKGFCTWTFSSGLLRENNFGAYIKMMRKHFEMALGTDSRTYVFRNRATDDFEIEKKCRRLHEKLNIMYSFCYNLKKTDDKWNIGLTLTDMDHYITSQETNPSLCLHGFFRPGSRFCLFEEVWYKAAGAPNRAINHFGYFLRTGIIWNFR